MTKSYIASRSVLIRVDQEQLSKQKFQGIIYLDRDGVIIEDYGYVGDKKKVKLIHGARDFIKIARLNRYLIAVITNQSGIGRGYYTWDSYIEVTNKMNSLLGREAEPHIIIACGVKPISRCEGEKFRKPNTGMVEYIRKNIAKAEYTFEMLVGDKLSDIQCGLRSGIKVNIHVLTGHGADERSNVIKEKNGVSDEKIILVQDLSQLIELMF